MVVGLKHFIEYFEPYKANYILIGGAACDFHFDGAGLPFRATKDLDLIIIVENLNPDFASRIWDYISAAGYNKKEKSEGLRIFYRFKDPSSSDFPKQLEFFSRNPGFNLKNDSHLTPITVSEEISSLSAILMNDDYYQLTIDNSPFAEGLHLASVPVLICLKSKAFFDLRKRKSDGEKINDKDIKKHRNDIIRLSTLLSDEKLKLPDSVYSDVIKIISDIENDPPDLKALLKEFNLKTLSVEQITSQIRSVFQIY